MKDILFINQKEEEEDDNEEKTFRFFHCCTYSFSWSRCVVGTHSDQKREMKKSRQLLLLKEQRNI